MQDFNYLFSNSFEITVELSCCKYPLSHKLQDEWSNNKESLIAFVEEGVHMGIKGVVTDSDGEPINAAFVEVEGIDKLVSTTDRGEYWRLLTPGTYNIRALDPERTRYSDWQTVIVRATGPQALRADIRVNVDARNETSSYMELVDSTRPLLTMPQVVPDQSGLDGVPDLAAVTSSMAPPVSSFSVVQWVCEYLPVLCQIASFFSFS